MNFQINMNSNKFITALRAVLSLPENNELKIKSYCTSTPKCFTALNWELKPIQI